MVRLALAVALACVGCSSITQTRPPSRENPTSWTFARPLADVRTCLEPGRLVADAWGATAELDRYAKPPPPPPDPRTYRILVKSEGYGSDAVHSETFLFKSCPLGLYGHWRIDAAPVSDRTTRVDVVPLDLHVHNYRCSYIGHPWGCAISVRHTTVEEYRMLLSIGACLGVRDIPPVHRPAGDPPRPETCG